MSFNKFTEKLKEINFSQDKYSACTVSYEITTKCNLDCKHCYNHSRNNQFKEVSLKKKKQIISNICNYGTIEITLCGGEPFNCNDILPIISYIKQKKLRIIVLTNGLLIDEVTIKFLADILDENDLIQISIDNFYSNNILQRNISERDFEYYAELFLKLNKYKITYSVNIVCTRINQNEVLNLFKYLCENGVSKIGATPYLPFGGELYDKICPDYAKLQYVEKECIKCASLYNVTYTGGISGHPCESYVHFLDENSKETRYRNCYASAQNIHIDCEGNIFPCVMLVYDEFKIGSIFETNDLLINMRNTHLKIKQILPNLCDKCSILNECGGGCSGLIYDRYRNLNGIDPRCRYQRKVI